MKDKNVKIIIVLCCIICVLLCGMFFIFKKYLTLKNSKEVKNIGNSIVYSQSINNEKENTKNILFIGNSITFHDVSSYWFSSWGMAASSKDKDFVHLVVKKIGQNNNVNFKIAPFSAWEVNAHDRGEFLPMLDEGLKTQNDYIVIQLGENVTDVSTFKNDYIDLIKYIKKKNPNAKIVVMGNFYFAPSKKKTEGKINACKKMKVKYIDLSDIDNEQYYLGKGKKVLGDDKKYHLIEHEGVMVHPNDKAMEIYADRIYDALTTEI